MGSAGSVLISLISPARVSFLQSSDFGFLVIPIQKYPSRGEGRDGKHLSRQGEGVCSPAMLAQLSGLAPPVGGEAETWGTDTGKESICCPASLGSIIYLSTPYPGMNLYHLKNTGAPGLISFLCGFGQGGLTVFI